MSENTAKVDVEHHVPTQEQVVDVEAGQTSPVQRIEKSQPSNVDEAKPLPPPGKYDYPQRPPNKYSMSASCPPPPCYRKKIGRFYVFVQGKDGRPIIMVGPCWPMYFVTFTLIAGGTAAVLGGLARDIVAICVVGAVLASITLVAFTMTACRDPGIIPRRQQRLNSDEIYDERAMTYRPRGAIFEGETNTIIQDIDHFCPWTSTVIAKSNMFCFLVFTRTLCVLILFAIGVTIWGVSRLGTEQVGSR